MKNYRPFLFFLFSISMLIGCHSTNSSKTTFQENYEKALHNYYSYRDSLDYYFSLLKTDPTRTKNKKNEAIFLHFQGIRYSYNELPDSALSCYLKANRLLSKPSKLKVQILASLVAVSNNLHNDTIFNRSFNEFEALAKSINDPFYFGRYYSIKATAVVRKGDVLNGIKYYKIADSIYNSIQEPIWQIHAKYSLGKNYALQSDYDLAFQYYLDAAELAKKEHANYALSNCYLGLSRLYRKLHQYDKALEYVQKFETLYDKNQYKARAYEAYAIIYAEQKNWVEAEKYMLQSLKVREEIGDPSGNAVAKNNLGTLYTRMKEFKKAEKFYKEALLLRYEYNMEGTGLLRNLNNLGDLYLDQNQPMIAINLFREAIDYTNKNPNLRLSSHANLQLAEIYKSQGLLKESLDFYLQYAKENKELDAEKAQENLAKLIVEHDLENQKKIIELQRKEKIKDHRSMLWLALAVLFLIISIILITVWYRQNNRMLKRDIEKQKKLNEQQLEINNLKERLEVCANNNVQNILIKDILNLFEKQKVYTDPNLSLEKLARMLNTNTTYISNAINTEFECNFKSLLNRFRVEHCKQKIQETTKVDYPLKKIVQEAGFISMSTFYTAFKKEMGMTPAMFREVINAKIDD